MSRKTSKKARRQHGTSDSKKLLAGKSRRPLAADAESIRWATESLLRRDLESGPSPAVCRAMARFWAKMAELAETANVEVEARR